MDKDIVEGLQVTKRCLSIWKENNSGLTYAVDINKLCISQQRR
jgi:hypothetical protein